MADVSAVLPVQTTWTWRLRTPKAQVCLDDPLRVQVLDAARHLDGEAGADDDMLLVPEREPTVSLHRRSGGGGVVRSGEPVAIRVHGAGFLSASRPVPTQRGSRVMVVPEPVFEWIVTGVAPGVETPVDRPVGMFNLSCGEHLVVEPDAVGIRLGWASRRCPGPEVELPVPKTLRPPESLPQVAEFTGTRIPVQAGSPSSGFTVLLDWQEARDLGRLVSDQRPEQAGNLAPERTIGAIVCRGSQVELGAGGGNHDPEPGARIWVQARLVADPEVCADPVRVLAWAETAQGNAVTVAPTGPDWPEVALTWWVRVFRVSGDHVVLPEPAGRPDPSERPTVAVYLPLPSRDGEPGSTTTVTPTVFRGRGTPPPAAHLGVPGLLLDPRNGRRALRLVLPDGPTTVTWGWTVRVHLPG